MEGTVVEEESVSLMRLLQVVKTGRGESGSLSMSQSSSMSLICEGGGGVELHMFSRGPIPCDCVRV